jgi:hypothetical protein
VLLKLAKELKVVLRVLKQNDIFQLNALSNAIASHEFDSVSVEYDLIAVLLSRHLPWLQKGVVKHLLSLMHF